MDGGFKYMQESWFIINGENTFARHLSKDKHDITQNTIDLLIARGVHCTKHVRVYVNAQMGY